MADPSSSGTVMRVALLGAGTIAHDVAAGLLNASVPGAALVGVLTRSERYKIDGVPRVDNLPALIALRPDVVAECAGADAFAEHVPALLAAGIDVIAVSMAAMARVDVERAVTAVAGTRGAALYFASGALGGLDVLTAAREGGLTRVEVIQRKPPAALMDAGQAGELTEARVVKRSSAREVALALPQNSNVAAAAAIAGLGFDQTLVTVIADPSVSRNSVELQAEGRFGSLRLVIENHPSPANPKTSLTPAMSVLAALRRRVAGTRIPG